MNNKSKDTIIWAVIVCLFVAAATCGACMANAAPSPQVIATIQVDSTKTKTPEKVGQIKVQHKDGRVEIKDLYRGSRGGYFYYTGKTGKDGKPERKYLTKKEKEANNLK